MSRIRDSPKVNALQRDLHFLNLAMVPKPITSLLNPLLNHQVGCLASIGRFLGLGKGSQTNCLRVNSLTEKNIKLGCQGLHSQISRIWQGLSNVDVSL